jgi:hypothetical protein
MQIEFAVVNAKNCRSFCRVPKTQRALFISHCLRKVEVCPYQRKEGGEGLFCQRSHENCQINQILSLAEKSGYQMIFIVSGFTAVQRLIEQFQPQALIGIACPRELNEAIKTVSLTFQVIELQNPDCELGSHVNLDEVERVLSY